MSGLIKKNILGALFLLLLPFFAHAQQADISTQNLPSGGQLQTGDQIVVTRGNNTLNAGWPPLSLPPPTTATLGGLYALGAPTANQWVSYVDALGVQHLVQPYFANIGGTVAGAQLPTPTLSALGGVFSLTPPSHEFLSGLYDNGTFAAAQPAFSDISGVATASQIPYPTSGTIGGIESFAAQSNQFLTGVTTGGVPTAAQPAFTNLTGNIAVSQMNGGSGASSSTYWRGDGTWAANGLPSLGSNQFIGSLTTGIPSGQSVPSCSGSQEALIYTAGTGFGCTTVGGSGSPTGTAGGDLGGNYPNPTVAGVGDVTTGVLPQANGGTGVNTIYNARGVPSNQWTALDVVGDANSYNSQYVPINRGWGGILANQMGVGPTYDIVNDFSHYTCDVVNTEIVPNILPTSGSNPIVAWLPNPDDLGFGGGFYQAHEQDTNSCRLAGLTWASIPVDGRVYAQTWTTTGTWSNSSSYAGFYGITSNTNGDTATGSITTNGGPIYLWYLMQGNDGGTFNWKLDSTITGSVAVQGNNQFTYPIAGGSPSASQTLGAVRIPVTTAPGAHSVNITLTSTTSSANSVTIEGIGTPAKPSPSSKGPAIVLGGYFPGTTGPAANNGSFGAFNNDTQQQAAQLVADGLQVPWANTALYFDYTNDYLPNASINAQGQTHIAHAFGNAIQPVRNSENAINPIDFGASCNSIYFPGDAYTATDFSVRTTKGSPNITILNYTFQPGVATQFGGGDVGKEICLSEGGGGDGDPGPCTYVLSVSTTSGGSSAVLGANVQETDPGAAARMGGYPKNPNDPSTAQDDSAFINAAGQASILNGGNVFLPTSCMGSNISMPTNTWLHGNGNVPYYGQSNQGVNATPVNNTVFNCAMNGAPDGPQQCINAIAYTKYSNFMVRCGTFPYTPFGLSAAGIGYSTSGGTGPGAQVYMDHMSFFGCPVDFGQAYGYNHPVSFLATVTTNGDGSTSTMNVLSITSTNFKAADNWSSTDFLALNRTVTASGGVLGSGTVKIIAVPPGGGTGNYTINKSLTVSTSTAMTAPTIAGGIELRDEFTQHYIAGIGYNGDFTDSVITGSTCTGTFMNGCWRLGPNVESYGNGANRWIGGRMEEQSYSAITCDGCSLTITGLDSQFNGGYNIRTLGSGSSVQMTGGHMYGGGHCSGTPLRNTSILLSGTNPSVDVDGVEMTSSDYGSGCGGSTTYLFATDTGSSNVQASVEGGNTLVPGDTITGLYNWASGGAPSKYKQDTAGWPTIDTTLALTATSTGFSIGSLSGGALYATTSARSTGATGVITLTLPAVGTNWNCSGGDQTAPSAFVLGPTTSTSCALNATSTVTSGDVIWLSAPNGK